MNETKKHSLLTANLLFMILAFLFIIGSFVMAYLEVGFRWSIIIIQYVIIFIPIVLTMKIQGVSIKERFRFNPIKWSTVFKTILITLAAIPIAYMLNLVMNIILMELDLFQIQTMDLGETSGANNFFILTFLLALTPGLCEEFFFRGMMLSAYREKMSPTKAILITGILFGIFHFNVQNLLLPTFLGIILAWLVYTTNSIYPSMIAHGTFNFIGSLLMTSNQETATPEEMDMALTMLDESGLQILFVFIIMSAFAGIILFALMYWLKSDYVSAEAGDTIVLKEVPMEITHVDYKGIRVMHQDEEKRINMKTLKKLPYKIEKTYETTQISPWNYWLVSMVIVLYVGFTILSFSA
ncbi:CPBP family intramembrane metalloprotease [Acidaminobacter sp. JC074]|uniref:type II CAAX endopeptidase family protein n=1 Tax=Acidaminobacter sp. JC074 TaxID=2530199 RepID=UPI001F0FB13A|nr:type II CAAX endopeptidase family protein [Acidaminobacter sp. JC074]MCH4891273.1 CPBP family intramembrane metalloprotease [Acidaminobacter sp. JC074]